MFSIPRAWGARPSHAPNCRCLAFSSWIFTARRFEPSANATCEPAKDVLKTYADIAEAGYADALATAKTLQLDRRSIAGQADGRDSRRRPRRLDRRAHPLQQTEAFRFGNAIVDDWEGRVNAWPLDEGLIDYVAGAYGTDSAENALYTANVIANVSLDHRRQEGRRLEDHARSCSPTRCRRPAASRPMSPPAITPSSSCSGART